MLDDSSNVRIINNTVANNVSTGSSENSRSATRTRPAWPPRPTTRCSRRSLAAPSCAADFSNPTALFNNIFWNNNAFTLDQLGPGRDAGRPGLHRLRDPRHDEQRRHLHPALLRPDQRPDPRAGRRAARRCPAGQGNLIGADPLFVTPFVARAHGVRVAARPADGGGHDHRRRTRRSGSTGDYHIADRARRRSTAACAAPTRRSRRRPTALNACTGGGDPGADRDAAAHRPTLRRLRRPVPAAAADDSGSARRGTSAPTSCPASRTSPVTARHDDRHERSRRRSARGGRDGTRQSGTEPAGLPQGGRARRAWAPWPPAGVVGALGRGCSPAASAATTTLSLAATDGYIDVPGPGGRPALHLRVHPGRPDA